MKPKPIVLMLMFFACSPGFAQLRIEDCYAKARENYPLIKQYDLIEQAEQFSLENIAKNYLPQFVFNGQASYQSDVTTIPIDFSALGLPVEIPAVSKDQYKVAFDVNQLIWDGGNTSSQKEVTKATHEVERKGVDVSLYTIEETVNQLYFGILAIDEKLKVLDLTESDILSNKETIGSMFKNGTAMQSDLDQIDVELLNLEQKRTEQKWMKKAYCKMLSLFINEDVAEDIKLEKPGDNYTLNGITRPELTLYDSQMALFDAQNSAVTAKNMPKISFYAQGGYGRPALNMLNDDFEFFGIGGVRLTWNFGNLYTKKNEISLLKTSKNNVAVQRETFLFNTDLQLTQQQSEIDKCRDLLRKDNDIIDLRNRVKKASESKFKNGVYQTNELIRDINAEDQARQSKALHEIQYLLSIHNYKHTQGN